MKFIYSIVILLLATTTLSAQDTLTNASIIKLIGLGLSKEVVVKKINTSVCKFNMSVSGLEQLQKGKVPQEIISMMLSKDAAPTTTVSAPIVIPKQKLEPGIYYLDSATNTFLEIDPSMITNAKSGGAEQVILRSISGLFKAKQKAVLAGVTSNYALPKRPMFAFVFDSSKKSLNADAVSGWGNIRTPNEFMLVRLSVKKASRELVTGSENNLQSEAGVEEKSRVMFKSEKSKTQGGVYYVTISETLPKGEYAFMYAGSIQEATPKVYDFSVLK
ncbi:MAG: hypothetical protein JWP69_569 [Flaviaesturariibacter sp.]|nr:hypothetical protein [Flaviaesturariibacter sp.]